MRKTSGQMAVEESDLGCLVEATGFPRSPKGGKVLACL